ncbi:hypothetical protein VOLCADRAFT_99225 [Volvox carteri f. nagariensis]|uniref:Uncharacterized protein n=1 Tax=Volvox carteri f. nagariensis TaxID=3068 RepID=D8UH96_VOLCA|nr:uncharacterized protein VOLCADRAFT_99225 [Volvox carteri f. nagariensis]EFJ40892.1 hypothetical protein VOLCADRAFT_99225 [Volvox carteri f. nagariensis]|eukprot:XP_002958052.1 hypothetical protein VOLCADRAFT_99225 [Volvox carteri f. nagariensis]
MASEQHKPALWGNGQYQHVMGLRALLVVTTGRAAVHAAKSVKPVPYRGRRKRLFKAFYDVPLLFVIRCVCATVKVGLHKLIGSKPTFIGTSRFVQAKMLAKLITTLATTVRREKRASCPFAEMDITFANQKISGSAQDYRGLSWINATSISDLKSALEIGP